jgi:beta-N-acetylhexosaminidase
VGRLFALGFEGTTVPEWLREFAAKYGLGAVILFARNCPDAATVRALTRQIHEELVDPEDGWTPLILVDQEGGRVERLKEGVALLPSAWEMSQMEDAEITRRAEEQSKGLVEVGFDVNLAPVCDVVRPGESGVIGDRAFGVSPEDVAQGAVAFYEGMKRGGILGCAKHFPGHGSSTEDTHEALGLVGLEEEDLKQTDLHPFRELVRAGVEMVMVAHLVYPTVDIRPATLSHRWIEGVLRTEMGFKGIVVADDMEMGALRGLESPPVAARQAIEAGCDLLIYGGMLDAKESPSGVANKLKARLAPEWVERSVERLWALRGGRPS